MYKNTNILSITMPMINRKKSRSIGVLIKCMSQVSDTTRITSSKIKNLPTVFLILKNSLACLRSLVRKNLPNYSTLVTILSTEYYSDFYILQDYASYCFYYKFSNSFESFSSKSFIFL